MRMSWKPKSALCLGLINKTFSHHQKKNEHSMMHYQYCMLLIFIYLLITPCEALSDTFHICDIDILQPRISECKAIEIAFSQASAEKHEIKSGDIRDLMCYYVQSDQTQQYYWSISVVQNENPPPGIHYLIDDKTGDIVYTTTDLFPNIQRSWEQEIGVARYFWPIETQYAFSHMYCCSTSNESLVQEDDITYDEAIRIARNAITQMYQESPDIVSSYKVSSSLLADYNSRMWMIGFWTEDRNKKLIPVHQVNIDAFDSTVLLID